MGTKQIITTCLQTLIRKRSTPTFLHSAGFTIQPNRESSYRSSKPVGSPDLYTNVEVSTSPEEWKYVERLLPSKSIPTPTEKSEYPSGWRPPAEAAFNFPYYIERNRNHMYPLHLQIGHRGLKRTTLLKRINGDIWALQNELKSYLEQQSGKHIHMQVHEVCGHIRVRGDYVSIVEEWLQSKGF